MYLFELCKAILTEFRNQMLIDGRLSRRSVGPNCIMHDDLEDEGWADLQGFLVAENSYGQILKSRRRTRRCSWTTSPASDWTRHS